MSEITDNLESKSKEILAKVAHRWFGRLIQPNQYVGEVYSISYEDALVQIHDFYRRKVGGIPSLSFLIATRVNPNFQEIDFQAEDSSIILLRVMDSAQLPNASEAERIRVQSAQMVSGEIDKHWDDHSAMDAQTNNLLSFAGVQCRVIGTFYLGRNPRTPSDLQLRFGSDISNYYPNMGLKVYKPNGDALRIIVNYIDPDILSSSRSQVRVPIGEVRYASTNRPFQGVSNVEVSITPVDILGQKTALFGMTRTGKSNTTKIIAKAIFDLRFHKEKPIRVGQIIFDPNGEYANENVQDVNNQKNPSALKNVWQVQNGMKNDVVTYGLLPHPRDPGRRIMKINFYDKSMLQAGKEIIDDYIKDDTSKYIQNFTLVRFVEPEEKDYQKTNDYYRAMTRFNRRVLAYRALLSKAGFTAPSNISTSTDKLFNPILIEGMKNFSDSRDLGKQAAIQASADTFKMSKPSWNALATAFEGLFDYTRTEEFRAFNDQYVKEANHDGENWADADLLRILEMFVWTKGANLIGRAIVQHTSSNNSDYSIDIYNDLRAGKLVIIDQGSGDPDINKASSERIMWQIFRGNQKDFREGINPPDILIYIEEAHTLLPDGSEKDTNDVWVRTAKEGAKYNLGMVYITQEVSSIQKNILKNTANWFIGHLNNTDETRELKKFYDFADFENSIIRSQDKGFLRVKTLSNLFVVPVQIKRFQV